LLDVAAQLKCSAHAALALAINCTVIPVAANGRTGHFFRHFKVTFQVAALGAESAVYGYLVLFISYIRNL